jgi:glycosyltransferase involved in cell wall biosynthesis
MRRIVHLTQSHSVFDTRVFHKECYSIARAGYKVALCAPHDRNEIVDGVQIIGIPEERKRLCRITRGTWRVYDCAIRENADLYHFHDPALIPAGLLLWMQGKHVIYDIHEDVPKDLLSRYYIAPPFRRLFSWLFARLEEFAARRFSALVVTTPTVSKRFKGINENTVVVKNYPWKDELSSAQRVPWKNRPNAVVYVGACTKIRGIIEMVRAMDCIDPALQAHLKIAGTFVPPALYSQMVDMDEWKYTSFEGHLTREAVSRLLSQVRAGLVILHPELAYVQSLPTKMFEYMAAGLPVIASDFPLWRSIIERIGCGLLVDPLDLKDIGHAIEYVLRNPSKAEQMGQRGRKAVVDSFNWENESAKLLDLYADVLDMRVKHAGRPLFFDDSP